MCVAFRAGRQGVDQVDIKVGETAAGYQYGLDRCCVLCHDLGLLTGLTLSAPLADVGGHALPHESGGYEPSGGSDSRVC